MLKDVIILPHTYGRDASIVECQMCHVRHICEYVIFFAPLWYRYKPPMSLDLYDNSPTDTKFSAAPQYIFNK